MKRCLFLLLTAGSLFGCAGAPASVDALNKCNEDYRQMAQQLADVKAKPCDCPAAAATTPAAGVLATITLEDLARYVEQAGFKVLERRPEFILVEIDGVKCRVFTRGTNAQLYAVFEAPNANLAVINEWNKTKRFSRAYLDNDGDPVIESDVDLEGGITGGSVVEWVKTYRISLVAFAKVLFEQHQGTSL